MPIFSTSEVPKIPNAPCRRQVIPGALSPAETAACLAASQVNIRGRLGCSAPRSHHSLAFSHATLSEHGAGISKRTAPRGAHRRRRALHGDVVLTGPFCLAARALGSRTDAPAHRRAAGVRPASERASERDASPLPAACAAPRRLLSRHRADGRDGGALHACTRLACVGHTRRVPWKQAVFSRAPILHGALTHRRPRMQAGGGGGAAGDGGGARRGLAPGPLRTLRC
jgi:hypothetical protein